MRSTTSFLWILVTLSGCETLTMPRQVPRLVSLAEVAPSVVVDMRYAGSRNFVGRPVAGYRGNVCLLSRAAATALAKAQSEAAKLLLSLKVYDCYRPQRAVDDFFRWAHDLKDERMKAEFYPAVPKARLFQDGYISERSGHSRGSTVDVTLVPLPTSPAKVDPAAPLVDCRAPAGKRAPDESIDMGTGYDCFDPLAHTAAKVPALARENRRRLKEVMEKAGFENFEMEWWHYTLKGEPYRDTYFDVDVR